MSNRIDFEEPEGKGCLIYSAWVIIIVLAVAAILIARALLLKS